MELRGTTAVVTGGGNGIGRALCSALAAEGVNIVVADIDANAARSVSEELRTRAIETIDIKVDVSCVESVHRMAELASATFGGVELLFNNAGVIPPASALIETSVADAEWIFNVNVLGTLNCIREFAPRFQDADREARIINTASEHALGVPHVASGVYTASKHAILGLSDVLRFELPRHVRVSVLCPGIVATSLWRATERRQSQYGGPLASNPMAEELMQGLGMPVEEVATRAIAGVKRGDFYIVTHPHSVEYAEERWHEIQQSFRTYAPRYSGDERFNLKALFMNAFKSSNDDSRRQQKED